MHVERIANVECLFHLEIHSHLLRKKRQYNNLLRRQRTTTHCIIYNIYIFMYKYECIIIGMYLCILFGILVDTFSETGSRTAAVLASIPARVKIRCFDESNISMQLLLLLLLLLY